MTGKWHLGQDHGSPPWERGFDRALRLRAGGIYFPEPELHAAATSADGVGLSEPLLPRTALPTPRDAPVFGDNWYATDLWTNFGLRFIDDARQANKPFFLYLPNNAPHFPLMAPAEEIAKYRGKYKTGWDRLRQKRISPTNPNGPHRRASGR